MNLDRLAKMWALTGSPNASEASAARGRAQTMLAKKGKTLADVPMLLRGRSGQGQSAHHKRKSANRGERAPASERPQAAPGRSGFGFYDMNNPEHRAAFADQSARRRAERAARESPERAEVLTRYGSKTAALAWSEREAMLRAAVRR